LIKPKRSPKYIHKALRRFGMEHAKVVSTHLIIYVHVSKLNIVKINEEEEYMSHIPNANVVGSLMFVIICIRPNFSQKPSIVSRYVRKPKKKY